MRYQCSFCISCTQASIFLSENTGASTDLRLCNLQYLYAVGTISIVLCMTSLWKPVGPDHGTVAVSTGDHTSPNFALRHVFCLMQSWRFHASFCCNLLAAITPVSGTYLGGVRIVAVSRFIKYEYYRQYQQDVTSFSNVSLKWHESRNEYVK